MGKFIIFMWLCTATTTIDCRMIETERVKFKDAYDCTLYGYTHSAKLMRKMAKEGFILTKTKTQQKINIGSNVQWYEKDKLLTGVVVSITTKSYRVCCKPNKKVKDKGSTHLVPQINKKNPERQIKLMVETNKDIIDKYLKNTTEKMIYMINPIISIINKYNYYYKSQNFLKDLIEFIRQNINIYTENTLYLS